MKIAINVLPLQTAHRRRGIGYYTENLVQMLKKDSSIQLQEFTSLSEVKDADVVHYPWFDFFFHTLPIRKSFPTVVTVHDVIPLLFPKHYPVGVKGKIKYLLQKAALSGAKHIITDSKASKEDIIQYLGMKENKIDVIHLAADPRFRVINNDTELLHTKRKYQLPDQFLLYVGDANWVKNLPFLIESFNQIINSPGYEHLKLVLVGGVFLKNVENITHPELESLKQVNELIRKFNLEDKIVRPGQIEDDELVAFYNLAILYVQPSLYEGFGLPILQAFACGVPVVSSNKGSLMEVGGEAALYFDPSSLKQCTSIIKDLVDNKSLQDKLSKFGIKQAAMFSWEKVAKETKDVYSKVVNNDK